MIHPWLTPAADELFYKRGDKSDPRLGEIFENLKDISQLDPRSFVIVGYPDDEGVRLNGGRPGTAEGPSAIRRVFYKMTPPLSGLPGDFKFFDAGDLSLEGTLIERHSRARETVTSLLNQGARVLTFGGGHDYGYPDMAAFCSNVIAQDLRPAVINFDAHLDVRPDEKGPHSGTPFYRLLNEFGDQVDFFEVGIQDWCNARSHLEWAEAKGARVIRLEDILASGKTLGEILNQKIFSRLSRKHRVALSVDIDAFSSGQAPGASQVFPVGLNAQEFLMPWKSLVSQFHPAVMSFYEVSPPLDLDFRTARLAAILAHQALFTP